MEMMDIEQEVDRLRITRNNFINVIDGLSLDQLNKIPDSHSNNIIWNFAHSIISQQLLCYRLANTETRISDELVAKYKKGSGPEAPLNQAEVDELKQLSMDTCDWMVEDYKSGKLSENGYTEYTTSYNITLASAEDAIAFNNVHEGLHLGYAMALRKLV